jgi:hypothetical protein
MVAEKIVLGDDKLKIENIKNPRSIRSISRFPKTPVQSAQCTFLRVEYTLKRSMWR